MSDHDQPEKDIALAGEYALGVLSPEEAAQFEARLARDPELRALYAEWADHFAQMTDDIPEVAPPERLQSAITTRVFPDRAPRWRWFGLLGGLAVAATAAFLLLNTPQSTGPFPPAAPEFVATIEAEDGALRIQAAYDANKGQLYLDQGTAAPDQNRAFELWLIKDDTAPISLGVLPTQTRTNLMIPTELQGLLDGAILAISDEPLGGSPTGQATGPVLAIGVITKV